MAPQIPRMRIDYYDDDRSSDVVPVGQWEVNLAERKFGVGSAREGNLDAITYAAFLAGKRAGVVPDGVGYEAWAAGVCRTEAVEPGESQAPLGE